MKYDADTERAWDRFKWLAAARTEIRDPVAYTRAARRDCAHPDDAAVDWYRDNPKAPHKPEKAPSRDSTMEILDGYAEAEKNAAPPDVVVGLVAEYRRRNRLGARDA